MGNDWNAVEVDPPPASNPGEPERTTVSVHSLLTPATAEAFEAWANHRGMKVSAAVRSLILDALWREARGEPLGALPGDLPPSIARGIVTDLEGRRRASEA